MHEVDNKHLWKIKIVTEFLYKCILSCTKEHVSDNTWNDMKRTLNLPASEQSK